jgi:hypothetical protein
MQIHSTTGASPNATGLPKGLPLFDWANARPLRSGHLPASLAVSKLARQLRIPLPLARTIAELAGFPVEMAHA